MADLPISGLPPGNTPTGIEPLAVDQDNTTKQLTLDQLKAIYGDVLSSVIASEDKTIVLYDGTTGKIISISDLRNLVDGIISTRNEMGADSKNVGLKSGDAPGNTSGDVILEPGNTNNPLTEGKIRFSVPTAGQIGKQKLWAETDPPGGGGWADGFDSVRTIVATDTTTKDDDVVLCDGTFTLNIVAASLSLRRLDIKNRGVGVITLDPNGGETIDGESSVVLNTLENLTIISNGSNWFVL